MSDFVKKCPECGGINLFWNKDKGEVICKDCGLVVEEKMVDFGQEWREFDSSDGDKKRRTGAPMTYTQYDGGLGTELGTEDITSVPIICISFVPRENSINTDRKSGCLSSSKYTSSPSIKTKKTSSIEPFLHQVHL